MEITIGLGFLLLLMVLVGGIFLGRTLAKLNFEVSPQQMQKFIEAAKLVLKIENLEKELEQEKTKTKQGIKEIHDLVFFRDIASDKVSYYRSKLEKRLEMYKKGCQGNPSCEDAAVADFYQKLLDDLKMTWPNEAE